MNRRKVLAAIGTGALPGAGCLATGGDGQGTPTPTSHAPTSTMPHCEGAERNRFAYDVAYGTPDGFELAASAETVRTGEQITVSLTNATDADRATGNRSKYDVQRSTGDDWRSVFWPSEANAQIEAYYDDSVRHSPGDGFEWAMAVSREGLAHEIQHGVGYLAVCEPIEPGAYRFVYRGLPETDRAVGVQFEVADG